MQRENHPKFYPKSLKCPRIKAAKEVVVAVVFRTSGPMRTSSVFGKRQEAAARAAAAAAAHAGL